MGLEAGQGAAEFKMYYYKQLLIIYVLKIYVLPKLQALGAFVLFRLHGARQAGFHTARGKCG